MMDQPVGQFRLTVGITGATGAIYGVRMLEVLRDTPVETHVIMSEWARKTIITEVGRKPDEVLALADYVYDEANQAARLSSGSFLTGGMVVAPCSMKTLAAIATGYAESLIPRAADVCLKEGRKVLLMVREAPLSAIHLENMLKLARLGVVIMPPVPAFYRAATVLGRDGRSHRGSRPRPLRDRTQSRSTMGRPAQVGIAARTRDRGCSILGRLGREGVDAGWRSRTPSKPRPASIPPGAC